MYTVLLTLMRKLRPDFDRQNGEKYAETINCPIYIQGGVSINLRQREIVHGIENSNMTVGECISRGKEDSNRCCVLSAHHTIQQLMLQPRCRTMRSLRERPTPRGST